MPLQMSGEMDPEVVVIVVKELIEEMSDNFLHLRLLRGIEISKIRTSSSLTVSDVRKAFLIRPRMWFLHTRATVSMRISARTLSCCTCDLTFPR